MSHHYAYPKVTWINHNAPTPHCDSAIRQETRITEQVAPVSEVSAQTQGVEQIASFVGQQATEQNAVVA